eukprot:s3872_g3.t1
MPLADTCDVDLRQQIQHRRNVLGRHIIPTGNFGTLWRWNMQLHQFQLTMCSKLASASFGEVSCARFEPLRTPEIRRAGPLHPLVGDGCLSPLKTSGMSWNLKDESG